MAEATSASSSCIFCQIAQHSTSTTILHSDDKVAAFQDINPSAFRHYLLIPVDHIPTVRILHPREENYTLVNHMLSVGQMLLHRDAPQSKRNSLNVEFAGQAGSLCICFVIWTASSHQRIEGVYRTPIFLSTLFNGTPASE